jgi:hypothetical protein
MTAILEYIELVAPFMTHGKVWMSPQSLDSSVIKKVERNDAVTIPDVAR